MSIYNLSVITSTGYPFLYKKIRNLPEGINLFQRFFDFTEDLDRSHEPLDNISSFELNAGLISALFEFAKNIDNYLLVFEDILRIDDRGIREILNKVASMDLVCAMKSVSEELKNKILSNLSQRAAQMLQEDLEVMGPVYLVEVNEAKNEILKAANDLVKEGTITFGPPEKIIV